MDRRRLLLAAVVLAPVAARLPAQTVPAAPPEVRALWPGAQLQGSARMRFLGFHVYDARLWVPAAPPRDAAERERYAAAPFALELEYARALEGRRIAERSIEEMARAGPLAPAQAEPWLAFMQRSFPDVVAGSRLTGVYGPDEGVRFFHDGRPCGESRDGVFARRFFGIWLAPETSQPALRRALLGIAA